MENGRAGRGSSGSGVQRPAPGDFTAGTVDLNVPRPGVLVVPLHQHTGAPCEPLVNVGDRVRPGQKVGDSCFFSSAPVHASLGGKVVAVEPRPYFTGSRVNSIVIEVDHLQPPEALGPQVKTLADVSPGEIRTAIREAGIVGLGNVAFPAHVKLTPPPDRPISLAIINGCECEPFLTCDHRSLTAQPGELIEALHLIMLAVGASSGCIAVGEGQHDAIHLLSGRLSGNLSVVPLETRFPRGAERQLIRTVLKHLASEGSRFGDDRAVVHNVEDALAIRQAVLFGRPKVEKLVTVSGPTAEESMSLRVRLGTPVSHVLQHCRLFKESPAGVVLGSPVAGWAQSGPEVPVVKGTSGIIALPRNLAAEPGAPDCVSCGKCADACPMRLLPSSLALYSLVGMPHEAERWGVMACLECGTCSYVCPFRRPLVLSLRRAKAGVLAHRRRTQPVRAIDQG